MCVSLKILYYIYYIKYFGRMFLGKYRSINIINLIN